LTQSKSRGALALILSSMVLCGAVTFTAAAPQKKAKKPVPTAKVDVAAAKKVYTREGCGACHAISGQGGKTGPELTHIGKTWSADKMFKQARNPKQFKKDAIMPAYPPDKISDKELKNLCAYLATLK
jgi:cbb3-type cytochrome oxidase cytochrome c subunit